MLDQTESRAKKRRRKLFFENEPKAYGFFIFLWGLIGAIGPHMGTLNRTINISYRKPHLHFKNFARKLRLLAMSRSFTGRIITTIPVVLPVVSITVVVSVPV
jgi:hypothetical protein